MKLIENARDVWKFWSVQCVVALGLWNMVPMVLGALIPPSISLIVSAFLLGSAVLARVIPQPKLEKTDGDKSTPN